MAKDKDGKEIVETPPNDKPPKENLDPINIIDDEPPKPKPRARAEQAPVDFTPVIEAVNNIDKKVSDFIEGQKPKDPPKDPGFLEDLDQLHGF